MSSDPRPTKTSKEPTFTIWLIVTPTAFRIKHRIGKQIHTITEERTKPVGDRNQQILTTMEKGLDWLSASLHFVGWLKSRFDLIIVSDNRDIIKVVRAGCARSVILSRIIKSIRSEVERYASWRIETTNER